jgi:hypothetical protein
MRGKANAGRSRRRTIYAPLTLLADDREPSIRPAILDRTMNAMEPETIMSPVEAMMNAPETVREPLPVQGMSPPTAPVGPAAELGSDGFAALIYKIGAPTISELDKMIGELQEARSYLQAEGERIEREAVGYTELSQTALESVRIISDTVSEWRKAGHPVRNASRA